MERVINGISAAYVNKEKISMNVSCFSYEEHVTTVILSAGVKSVFGEGGCTQAIGILCRVVKDMLQEACCGTERESRREHFLLRMIGKFQPG